MMMDMTVATKCTEAIKLCPTPFPPVLDTTSVPLPKSGFQMAPPVPPSPPPPPPPLPLLESTSPSLLHKPKLKKVNWIPIPKERILGKNNIWTADKYDDDFQLDTSVMKDLFEQVVNVSLEEKNIRRSFKSSCPYRTSERISLLDSRRSMNVGIFLKQFKRSAQEIVEDIRHGTAKGYGSEELTKLLKLLPEAEEVKRLKMFQGDQCKLPEADLFMLLLVRVPSYYLRLEIMILKEEFEPQVKLLLTSVCTLMEAAQELQNCNELHTILRLVLKAGNFMNAEAGKKDKNLLSFPDKLEHIGAAARLSEDGLTEELNKLEERLDSLRTNLHEDPELEVQMTSFLQTAKKELEVIWEKIELFQKLRKSLVEYFCEDEKFKLEEYCIVLKSFCEKFLKAIQENTDREIAELRRQQKEQKNAEKRHSVAICSSIENELGQDELERAFIRNLRPQSMRRWECKSFKRDTFSDAYSMKKPSSSGEVTQVERERDTNSIVKDYNDEELGNLMRKVTEKVLNQQLGPCVKQPVNPVPKKSITILNQEPETKKASIKTVQEPEVPQQALRLDKDYSKVNCRTVCSTTTKLKPNDNLLTKSNPSHCSKWKRESLERSREEIAAAKGKQSNQSSPTAKRTCGAETSINQKVHSVKTREQKDTELNKDNRGSLITNRKGKVSNPDANKIYPTLTQGQRGITLGHKGQVDEKFSPRPTLTQRNLQAPVQRQLGTLPRGIKQMSSIKEKTYQAAVRNGRKSIQSPKEKSTSSQSTSPITGSRTVQSQSETATTARMNPHAKQSMLLKKPNSEKVVMVNHQTDSLTHKGAIQQCRPLKKSRQPVWR
ncbi:uncharacterized protein fhdc2 isoform X2 [Hypanus sabinus]|uniref:uncharacterized protein fhdc2 isoform X2 n=1 Tax=Hypanus sabinus TaxID=79690 RepID=UPI0028C38B6A|nr:uncharacterized protein fhdc2 isoform X2 [Hypanus sabinus]